jgi:hypothetical protein
MGRNNITHFTHFSQIWPRKPDQSAVFVKLRSQRHAVGWIRISAQTWAAWVRHLPSSGEPGSHRTGTGMVLGPIGGHSVDHLSNTSFSKTPQGKIYFIPFRVWTYIFPRVRKTRDFRIV